MKERHRMHVLPVGDRRLHCAQTDCFCYPIEVETDIWDHNAVDCREVQERQGRPVKGKGWVHVLEKYVDPSSSTAPANEPKWGSEGGCCAT